MPQVHFNHGNKNSISKHRASINTSIARVCVHVSSTKSVIDWPFPPCSVWLPHFCCLPLAIHQHLHRKVELIRKAVDCDRQMDTLSLRGERREGEGGIGGERERRRREWGKGRSLLTVLQANLCGTFLGRKTFQNTDYKPYNDRYNACQKT